MMELFYGEVVSFKQALKKTSPHAFFQINNNGEDPVNIYIFKVK